MLSLSLLLLLLVGIGGDVLEGDVAFYILAGEDSLLIPFYKDSYIRMAIRRHGVARTHDPSRRK